MIFNVPSSVTSDTMAQIFVVPISNPTRICSRFATASPPLADNDAVVVAQIHVLAIVLTAVQTRYSKCGPHFHEPIPLLLQRLASEMKAHPLCRSNEVHGMTDIDLDSTLEAFGHPFGQFDRGMEPLFHVKIALRKELAIHPQYEGQ